MAPIAINPNGQVDGHSEVSDRGGHARASDVQGAFEPIAICGMACRLPGGVSSPSELWDFLVAGRDGRCRVPKTRFNLAGHYSDAKRPGTVGVEYGYFLDESVDLAGVDTTFTAMGRSELELLDPQQRLLLEVVREALHDAGTTGVAGSATGVYIGSFGEDWHDILRREDLQSSLYAVGGSQDYMVSARVSHELDLRGPNMTIRTACSSSMIALNEACAAIAKGDCESAVVAGSNLILTPNLFSALSGQGVLSADGSSRSLSADANGYARGEGIVAVYVKSLSAALRDGNPVRSVIAACAANSDGRTMPSSMPSAQAQATLIRHAYALAGVKDVGRTGLFECHATGTATGDPIECAAVADVFGHVGVHIGTVKPNMGHSEAASGLTAILKATLALEHAVIPPNIKYAPLNPLIPFERAQLHVPTEPTPWPRGRDKRVSVNSFGIGGSNAHAILEAPARFLPAPPPAPAPVPAPELLLFSANSGPSLRHMCSDYQALLELDTPTHAVADIAYTLANGRDHLHHRSYAVAGITARFQQPASLATPPPAAKGSPLSPSLVLVFTGQGAAWPQMGRDLVRSNPVFARSIDLLDAHLKCFEANWSLKDELLKPARTSRVYEAEFSQPLCTALQIGLVDALASMGVRPQAVVGHSSGEIGAAYAAGALTAKEALTVAFHRGVASKRQTEPGGMAAVGLGWDAVQQYLVPGVVAACDNSPTSVTLSGDADKLSSVVASIIQAQPDVPATILKVDKAYHSHHMVALGEHYHQAMVDAGVVGNPPTIPFFSSVTGHPHGNTKGSQLGPPYWQSNLERPVLFKGAVQALLASAVIKNPVLLEIGPHSALAGPLRQILTAASSNAAYVASLVRRQNTAENLLHTIGKLYTLHVALDFKSVVTSPASLVAGLPRYPWHHAQKFWYESRMSKEWLNREHVHHPLLGSRVIASTDLEPIWRNFLSPKYTPWIAHHQLSGSIVFPLAGFVSIAAEAGRQVSGLDDGVSVRNLIVHNALVVDGESPTEIVTSLRRERLTDTSSSTWWEFTISSYNGHIWTKHTTGDVRGEAFESQVAHHEEPMNLPRKVDKNGLYESVRRAGLDYGPTFNTLENVETSTTTMTGTATMRNNQWGDEVHYHVHPVVLDSYYQLMSCSVVKGIGRDYRRMVAAKIEMITMFRSADDEINIFSDVEPSSEGYIANGWVSAGLKKVLSISGSHGHVFEETAVSDEGAISGTARSQWVPHCDFQNSRALIKEPSGHAQCLPLLDDLAQVAITLASRAVRSVDLHAPHLARYKEWLLEHTPSDLADSDVTTLTRHAETLAKKLETTAAAPVAAAILAISASMDSILQGKNINYDDSVMAFLQESDNTDYIRSLAYTKPNLKVLEVGAGFSGNTSRLVKCLTHTTGQPMYSQLLVTNASTDNVSMIKERLRDVPNSQFALLDVTGDLAEQGFEDGQFDLIIATNININTDIKAMLQNIRQMLRPDGRLLLQAPRLGHSWADFILGIRPHWWSPATDMSCPPKPFLSTEEWQSSLATAGFSDIEHIKPISENWTNSVLIARPQAHDTPSKRVTLLVSNASAPEANHISSELEAMGYTNVDRCELGQTLPASQDILALLEEDLPFFEDIDSARLDQFKALLRNLGQNSLIWATRLSSIGCTDPRYAQVVGLARTIRSEMGIDFAVLETDKVMSKASASAVANVLSKFQARDRHGAFGPDLEYAIYNGQTLVNRIFPFSLDDELIMSQRPDEAAVTQQHPGRLNTLTWSVTSPDTPKDNEVEIAIHATGLNFRDVLVGMQIIPGRNPTFGYEAAGVVSRVGPKVTRLAVGDRVVGLGSNLLSTVTTSPETYYEKLPEHVSFIEGASSALVFVTAIYGLRDVGRLTKGQSVLIHSGAGGVGLAAMQVARMLGAEIFTTVGSEEKVQYLIDTYGLSRNRIFNSRDASFVDDVLRETGGRGVDVVLNSLAGELLHATWKCVAAWGTMVEIGKRDLLGNARLDMAPFLANRNYCCFDMDMMTRERPELLASLLKFAMDCFAQGLCKPIRVDKVFAASRVLDAFRYMQKGKHIGKIVLEIHDLAGNRLLENIHTMKKIDAELDEAASYLLVGGLGGLGRSMAVWMAQRGARSFTFLSRSAGTGAHDADLVVELESMGCNVQLVRGDVTDPVDVTRAVGGTVAPLRGVVQMSMVLRDQMFDGMEIDDWNAVTRPKVQGTWNLHNAVTAVGCELDFFLLFSSLSGIVGQVGQANYASANTFLDAFVQYRTSQNLACTAIDLGAMEGIGYLSNNPELLRKMQGTGWSVVQETELLRALPLAMMSPATRSQCKQDAATGDTFLLGLAPTVPLSSPKSSTRLKRDPRLAVYHNAGSGVAKDTASAPDTLNAFLTTIKKDTSLLHSTETVEIFALEVGKKLCSLVLADDSDLRVSANVSDIGLDSLVAVEMRGWWKLTFGFEISTLDLLSLGTLEAMGKRVADELITKYNA
ncbi:Beta-ketoacyl synthase [Pyrenophora teres f. maculata]|nr:Beta-ketoacyl synthase [Pyrenophora teres f. maculata]